MGRKLEVNVSRRVLGKDACYNEIIFCDANERGELGVEVGTNDVCRRGAEVGDGIQNLTKIQNM